MVLNDAGFVQELVLFLLDLPWDPEPMLLHYPVGDDVSWAAEDLAAALASASSACLTVVVQGLSSGELSGDRLRRGLAMLCGVNGLPFTQEPEGWPSIQEEVLRGLAAQLLPAASMPCFAAARPAVLGALSSLLARRASGQLGGETVKTVTAALRQSMEGAAWSVGGGSAESQKVWEGCMLLATALGRTGILPLLQEQSPVVEYNDMVLLLQRRQARVAVVEDVTRIMQLLRAEATMGTAADEDVSMARVARGRDALSLLRNLVADMPYAGLLNEHGQPGPLIDALQAAGEAISDSGYVTSLLDTLLGRPDGGGGPAHASLGMGGQTSAEEEEQERELARRVEGLLDLLIDIQHKDASGPKLLQLLDRLLGTGGAFVASGDCCMTRAMRSLWGPHQEFVKAHVAALHLLLLRRNEQAAAGDGPMRLNGILLHNTMRLLGRLCDRIIDGGDESADDEGEDKEDKEGFFSSSIRDVLEMVSIALYQMAEDQTLRVSLWAKLIRAEDGDMALHLKLGKALGAHRQGITLMQVLSLVSCVADEAEVDAFHGVEVVKGESVLDVLKMRATWTGIKGEEVQSLLLALSHLEQEYLIDGNIASDISAAIVDAVGATAAAGAGAEAVGQGGDAPFAPNAENLGMDWSA